MMVAWKLREGEPGECARSRSVGRALTGGRSETVGMVAGTATKAPGRGQQMGLDGGHAGDRRRCPVNGEEPL